MTLSGQRDGGGKRGFRRWQWRHYCPLIGPDVIGTSPEVESEGCLNAALVCISLYSARLCERWRND
jgi:hypothetical protein